MTAQVEPAIILASASSARAELLRRAGLSFAVEVAHLDEAEIKRSFRAERGTAANCAVALATTKAERVSRKHAEALVIGADQMLICDGEWFDKPADRSAARVQLLALRNRRHELISAVCVCRNGERLWHLVDRPALTMRAFSENFVEAYLAESGADILSSVGAYRLEARGAQLFSRVDGDFFSILGLPLLPLLGFLRSHGAIGQ
jgi:septum formation protein